MELSWDCPKSQEYEKFRKDQCNSSHIYSSYLSEGDIGTIDINNIHFENDEYWLCTVYTEEKSVTDLQKWLHKDLDINYNPFSTTSSSHIDTQMNINSRTFTRPKKRFTCPSIERYNEEIYGSSSETITIQPNSTSFIIEENCESTALTESSPNFDLSQPSSSYYFEKIIANSGEIDSFQNMSPPSLVNSMCSSTFANLMESSFIKNDPVLREIRDTDYSETVLLQDSEAPMFQSITESCSSINSDTPENFLKKVSFNGTFRKNMLKEDDNKRTNNNTFGKHIEPEKEEETIHLKEENSSVRINPDSTYRRTPRHNDTFKKSDLRKNKISACQAVPLQALHVNTTHTLIKDCNDPDLKQGISDPVEIHTDLNRLSYCLENDQIKLDTTIYNDINISSENLGTSTMSGSAGSADSLDRLSSMSSSSRGSNKMLNMADVDAIVEMQKRSLQQVMSTPKVDTVPRMLWNDNNFISPIISGDLVSDSEYSSNDDFKSVKSSISSKASLDNFVPKQPKSLSYLTGPSIDTKLKTNQKTAYNSVAPIVAKAVVKQDCYSNLKSVHSNIPGSYTNIYKMTNAKSQQPPVSATSNLKTMGTKLKGSYTSLRPTSTNLPVAPPLVSSNVTTTLTTKIRSGTNNLDSKRIVEVQPIPREKVTIVNDTFVRPQPVKASGLPRPTGIPRPASRIPAPRSSNVRPKSSRSVCSNSKMKTLSSNKV